MTTLTTMIEPEKELKSESHKSAKILLVDDRPENLYALEVILANLNYVCVKAKSGLEALSILGVDQDFAIILMDVQMPIMDGFETVERIRDIETIKHVPIIFLTASMDTSVHIFKGYKAGAVDFMIKPLSADILRAKVAVFVDLYMKSKEIMLQKEKMESLNSYILATNKGLAVQNDEKEKIAAQLIIANRELALQNELKEKRSSELSNANKELTAFNYISSHDLQEPLLKIQTFVTLIQGDEKNIITEKSKHNLDRMKLAVGRMQQLIADLLAFSRIDSTDRKFEKTDLSSVVKEATAELVDKIQEKNAVVEITTSCIVNINTFQFRQLMYNLLSNALKFAQKDVPSHIRVGCRIATGATLNNSQLSQQKTYCHVSVSDNGIGFATKYNEKIFEVFQKLHSKDDYPGTGIGLAIVKKIVENHNGVITANGELNKGATFNIYIPAG